MDTVTSFENRKSNIPNPSNTDQLFQENLIQESQKTRITKPKAHFEESFRCF